jgi:hypothetical protein
VLDNDDHRQGHRVGTTGEDVGMGPNDALEVLTDRAPGIVDVLAFVIDGTAIRVEHQMCERFVVGAVDVACSGGFERYRTERASVCGLRSGGFRRHQGALMALRLEKAWRAR